MPELSLAESISVSFGAQEPWPDNVKLFQPYEVEQILLPDNASCLAVQAFLKMCGLPFEVEMRWNAEFMSPSGRVPFIKCGAFVVSELESVVQFCGNKGASLCQRLSTEEKAEMRAYMSLISNVLLNAELYVSWLDRDTYNTVTRPRNSSVYPWPLGWLQTRAKRAAVGKRLRALHWHDKTLEQVLSDVEQCCNSLSQRLGDKEYFFGTPTQLDALLYGHVRALLAATGPKAHLAIRSITSVLLRHTVRVANLTQMKLKPQEDYLIAQALVVSRRRRAAVSPDRTSCRSRRARAVRSRGGDSLSRDNSLFGFKPFIAKQVVVMTSKDGGIYCDTNLSTTHAKTTLENWDSIGLDQAALVGGIVEEILDKVDEMRSVKAELFERNDFEIIVEDSEANEASLKADPAYKSYEILNHEDLTDIETGNYRSGDVVYGSPERADLFDVSGKLNGSIFDGDGVVNDKHLEAVSDEAFRLCGVTSSPNLSATLAGMALGSNQNISSESPVVTGSYASLFESTMLGADQSKFLEDTNVHEWIQSQLDHEFSCEPEESEP